MSAPVSAAVIHQRRRADAHCQRVFQRVHGVGRTHADGNGIHVVAIA
jgi:hypothetical protein